VGTKATGSARLGLAAFLLAASAPAAADSFEQIVARLAERHPQLQAAELTARAGREDIRAARAARLPQVALTSDAGWNRSRANDFTNVGVNPGLLATQLLYDGGRARAEIGARGARAESLEAERDRVFANLSARLAEGFAEWSRQRALLLIAADQVAALKSLQEMVREIATFDRGRAADVALVATRLAQAENGRDARLVAIADAEAAIRQVAAEEVTPEGELPSLAGRLPTSVDAALALAADHPQLKVAESQRAEADALADGARGWWKPQLSLQAGGSSETELTGRDRPFGAVQVRLTSQLNAIDGGSGSARLASARARASAARMDVAFTREAVESEVRRQWTLVAERRARLAGLESLVRSSDASRDIVFEQFKIGRRSVLDLLSFELDRFNARSLLETERRDLQVAEYRLLAALGRSGTTFVPGWQAASR